MKRWYAALSGYISFTWLFHITWGHTQRHTQPHVTPIPSVLGAKASPVHSAPGILSMRLCTDAQQVTGAAVPVRSRAPLPR
jgi:hypothetical protein